MGIHEATIIAPLIVNLHPRRLPVNGLVRQIVEPHSYAGPLDIHHMAEHDIHQQAGATCADGR